MSAISTPRAAARSAAPPSGRRLRMGARTRKAILLVHIVSAGAWIGIDVVMAVMVFTAVSSSDSAVDAFSYQALELFAVWPMATSGLLCLVSGVLLGLGTKYGLVRYWWVAVKLVLNLVLCTLVLVLLRPGVAELGEEGRRLATGVVTEALPVGDMVFPPVVSSLALLTAMFLSVFKPWGRIRRQRAVGDRQTTGQVETTKRR